MSGEDSPFARPRVMRGYPLDKDEESAAKDALAEVEDSQPPFRQHFVEPIRESEPPPAAPPEKAD